MAKIANIILDTNVLVGLVYKNDPHHETTVAQLKKLEAAKSRFFFNSLILAETCTVVLLRSKDQALARSVHHFLTQENKQFFNTPFIDQVEEKTYQIFNNQQKSRLSVADCSLIAQAKIFGNAAVFTFDGELRKVVREMSLKTI